MSEASDYLKRYQVWRSGEDDRTQDEAGITPAELTAATNAAIKEIELSESINTVNEFKLARANERIGELTAQNEYLSREMLTPDVFMRLIEWLREDPVKPASLAFTAGIARQVAYALEDDVVPLIKSARLTKQRVIFRGSQVGLSTFDEIVRDRDHWKANHDAQVQRARVLMDRIDMPFERVNAYHDYDIFKTGHDRYEVVRKMNVHQFSELFKRSLAGERFDDMVDAMVKP